MVFPFRVRSAQAQAKSAQAFCPRCGSPIYAARFGDAPKVYNIRLGTVRQRDQFVQSSSFGHARSCTGCLASPQFVRSRNRSGQPRHDHPHELHHVSKDAAWRLYQARVREQCQSPAVQMNASLFADAQGRLSHIATVRVPEVELTYPPSVARAPTLAAYEMIRHLP